MTKIEQEVRSNPSINWQKVKEVLCGLEAQLEMLCDELPVGLVKAIVCGVAKVLSMVCQKI